MIIDTTNYHYVWRGRGLLHVGGDQYMEPGSILPRDVAIHLAGVAPHGMDEVPGFGKPGEPVTVDTPIHYVWNGGPRGVAKLLMRKDAQFKQHDVLPLEFGAETHADHPAAVEVYRGSREASEPHEPLVVWRSPVEINPEASMTREQRAWVDTIIARQSKLAGSSLADAGIDLSALVAREVERQAASATQHDRAVGAKVLADRDGAAKESDAKRRGPGRPRKNA